MCWPLAHNQLFLIKKAIESLTRHAGIDTDSQKEYITLNWQAMLRNLESEGISWRT